MAHRFLVAILALAILTACKTDLHTGLQEHEANEIVSVLRLSGLSADREMQKDGLVTVRVGDADFAMAVEILRAEGYPRKNYSNLGEVFESKGFVSSQTEERARFIFAMSEELSRTISEIDGVLSARTHVVLPTSDPLARDTPPSSASVVIRHTEDAQAPALLAQIKMMVANSIEGLDYGNVSVVFIPVQNRPLAPSTPPAPRTSLPAMAPWLLVLLLMGGSAGGIAWLRRGRSDIIVERAK